MHTLWEGVYLMSMQGGIWAQGRPTHRILRSYSLLLHDYAAATQGAELHVACTLPARKAMRRPQATPLLTGYYSTTPNTVHDHPATQGAAQGHLARWHAASEAAYSQVTTAPLRHAALPRRPPGAAAGWGVVSRAALLTPHPGDAPPPPAPAGAPARGPAPRWRRRSCGSRR